VKIWIVMPTDKDHPDKDRMAVQPAGALGNDIALAVMRRCLFSKKLRSETQL
jgi:hypothetical protein